MAKTPATTAAAEKPKHAAHGKEISRSSEEVIRFKDPGGTVTIGGQTFHQGNITPATYKGLVAIDPEYAKLFEVHSREHCSCNEHDSEESKETAAPAGTGDVV